MEQKQPWMFGNPKYNKQMSLVCLKSGFWVVLLVKISTALKLVGRYLPNPQYIYIYIISSILMSIVESDVKNVNNFQVSPDLYGDNNTRLFTYWTVSISFYAFLLKKHHLFFNFVKIFIFNLNFTEWCISSNRLLQSTMFRFHPNKQQHSNGCKHLPCFCI